MLEVHLLCCIETRRVLLACIARHIVIVYEICSTAYIKSHIGSTAHLKGFPAVNINRTHFTVSKHIRAALRLQGSLDTFVVHTLYHSLESCTLGTHLCWERTFLSESERQSSTLTCLQIDNDNTVSQRRKSCTRIVNPISRVLHRRDCTLQVKFPFVRSICVMSVKCHLQTTQRKVAHSVRSLDEFSVDNILRLLLLFIENETTHFCQVVYGRLAIIVVRTSRPECLLVELYLFFRNTSIHHCSHL